jgi:hypothetical protein
MRLWCFPLVLLVGCAQGLKIERTQNAFHPKSVALVQFPENDGMRPEFAIALQMGCLEAAAALGVQPIDASIKPMPRADAVIKGEVRIAHGKRSFEVRSLSLSLVSNTDDATVATATISGMDALDGGEAGREACLALLRQGSP